MRHRDQIVAQRICTCLANYDTRLVSCSPLRDLARADFAELVDGCGLASHGTLGDLSRSPEEGLVSDRVGDSQSLDADDSNSRIVLRAIVLAIAKISHPGLQCRGVVFLDQAAVGLDGGGACK
jgi:hypothetical protein